MGVGRLMKRALRGLGVEVTRGDHALLFRNVRGSSLPLLQYFTEARGYAPAILCAIAGYAILDRTGGEPTRASVLGYWLLAMVGILAHATFILVLMALIVASLVDGSAPGKGGLSRPARFLVWQPRRCWRSSAGTSIS